eukprot:gene17527-5473_t
MTELQSNEMVAEHVESGLTIPYHTIPYQPMAQFRGNVFSCVGYLGGVAGPSARAASGWALRAPHLMG